MQAEQLTGGLRINLVPREGGNSFNGSFFATFVNEDWQGSNLTPELTARGLGEPNRMKQAYDFNPSIGGPDPPRQAVVLRIGPLPGQPELRGRHLRQQERR